MSPRYSDEFRKSIRNASFDEKLAILLRDSELPVAQAHEIAQALSRVEVTNTDGTIEEWTFFIRQLVNASNILKEVRDEVSQGRVKRYDPHNVLMMVYHDMITRIWFINGAAGILDDIAPQAVKSQLKNLSQMIETLSNAGNSLAEILEAVSSRPDSQSS